HMYCNACGRRNKGENSHKLATYIVKNPPVNNAYGKKGKGDKAEKSDKADKGDKKGKKNGASTPTETEEDQEDEFTKKIKEEVAAIPDADHYQSALGDGWSVDTSAQGAAARMKE